MFPSMFSLVLTATKAIQRFIIGPASLSERDKVQPCRMSHKVDFAVLNSNRALKYIFFLLSGSQKYLLSLLACLYLLTGLSHYQLPQ